MARKLRPDISEKNKYWIDRHRYYELKHFCLQYREWQKGYLAADELERHGYEIGRPNRTNLVSDPTERCAEMRVFYMDRMRMVQNACEEADGYLAKWIFKGVTEELSYDVLRVRYDIPCSKDTYYDRYRKFFWILSRKRG